MLLQATAIALLVTVGIDAKKSHSELKGKTIFSGNVLQDSWLQDKDVKARTRLQRRLSSVAIRKTQEYEQNQAQEVGGEWAGQYDNWWNNEMVVEQFGFDIDSYALKYTGCKVTKGYNEYIAENENYETVLGSDTYVTFRLCPEDTCNNSGEFFYGCSKNFGEYMVSLDEYINALADYRKEKEYNFCLYCETCAAMTAYTKWTKQMRSTMAGVAESFKQALQNFQAEKQAEEATQAQQNGYEYSQEKSEEEWEIEYYNSVHGNNNNQWGQNGDFQNHMSYDINSMAKQWWQYAGAGTEGNESSNNNMKSFDNGDWFNINSNTPTFCNQLVEPGYFDGGGNWVSQIGYWNKAQGVFVPFNAQTEDGQENNSNNAIPWDADCWGELPYGWENVVEKDPDNFVPCDSQYSSKCGNEYETCMYMLHYDDLLQIEFGEGYQYTEQEEAVSQTAEKFQDQILRETFTNHLSCQQVDFEADESGIVQSAYSNQANYQQLYKQKSNYMQALAACEDEDCEEAVKQAMDTDMNYQTWIIESAWELYEKYKAANQAYYVGAYCMEDGYNIGLKVFHDENCFYPNEDVSPSNVLGNADINGVHWDAVTSHCIPCRDQQFYQQLQDGAQEENLKDENADGVLAYCSMLYQIAAKCNKNLKPNHIYNQDGYYVDGVYYAPEFDQMYLSEQQADQEKKVCGMIESLNSGTYTEDGSIYFSNMGWMKSASNRLSWAASSMSGATKAFVFLFAIGAAAMGLWVIVLQGAIQRKMAPWQPKDPVDLARQESGIVMGRSRSGPATNPLI